MHEQSVIYLIHIKYPITFGIEIHHPRRYALSCAVTMFQQPNKYPSSQSRTPHLPLPHLPLNPTDPLLPHRPSPLGVAAIAMHRPPHARAPDPENDHPKGGAERAQLVREHALGRGRRGRRVPPRQVQLDGAQRRPMADEVPVELVPL